MSKGYSQCTASFTSTNPSLCLPSNSVTFTNTSTPGTNLYWSFPGSTSTTTLTGQNPTVTYPAVPGCYNVTLLIIDSTSGCSDSITQSSYVCLSSCSIDMTVSPSTSGCAPFSATFCLVNNSGFPAVNPQWTFTNPGGGTSNIIPCVTHTFPGGGSYTVCITCTLQGAPAAKCTTIVVNSAPVAQFTYSPPPPYSFPVLITFTNTSLGVPFTSSYWNFGDGGTATTQNASHTFSQPSGCDTITLIVTNTSGCSDTLIEPNIICDSASGIHTITSQPNFQISISPNPASAYINLTFTSNQNANIHCSLLNLLGEKMMEENFAATEGENHFIIPVSQLPKGIYFLKLEDGKGTVSRMLAVE